MESPCFPEKASPLIIPWLIELAIKDPKSTGTPTDRFKRNPLFEPRLLSLINRYLDPVPFVLPFGCKEVWYENGHLFLLRKNCLSIYDRRGRFVRNISHPRINDAITAADFKNNQLFFFTWEYDEEESRKLVSFFRFDLASNQLKRFHEITGTKRLFKMDPSGQYLYSPNHTTNSILVHGLDGTLVRALFPEQKGQKFCRDDPFFFDHDGNFVSQCCARDQKDAYLTIPVYRDDIMVKQISIRNLPVDEIIPLRNGQDGLEYFYYDWEGDVFFVKNDLVLKTGISREIPDTYFYMKTIPGYLVDCPSHETIFYRLPY